MRAAIGCKDTAIAFGTPFISGKDSLNNEFSYLDPETGEKRTVAIPSSLLISAIGQVSDIRQCVTMDLKKSGNVLYQVGVTRDERGGSHYALVNRLTGGRLPRVDVALAPQIFEALHKSIERRLVRSCHDLSEGGLAVAVSEMAFAGGLGADLDLAQLAKDAGLTDSAALLFSESTTRFLIEVEPEYCAQIEKEFAGLPFTRIGQVVSTGRVRAAMENGVTVLDQGCAELKLAWQTPLAWE